MLSLAFFAMANGASANKEEIILVGSNQIHFHEISKTKLRDLFTGQSQAVNNKQVLVIDRPEEFQEKNLFIHGVLGFTVEEFHTVQRLLECVGISKAPTIAINHEQMIEMLENNPNALGYLTQKEVTDHLQFSKLRRIKVLAE